MKNNLQIFQILIFYYHFHKKTENVMKTHISGGWRPTWWLSIRFKRNTERAQRFSFLLWVPLTWPGVAKNAYMLDIYKCSRASFSREHQTGILSWTINILLFWPRSVPKITPEECTIQKEKSTQFWPKCTRSIWLLFHSKWPKFS